MRRLGLKNKKEVSDGSIDYFFEQSQCYKICDKGMNWEYPQKVFFIGNHLYETERVKRRINYTLVKDSTEPIKRFDWFYDVDLNIN